ncbi:hypothetical protein ACJJTC_006071 [Scirpophaga incertulas]
MSRRSLFLLAAVVVLLYFSIIMVMLSPLNVPKASYLGHGYLHHFTYRQPRVHWCKELQWRSPPVADVVALVSHPGSGNTWLRYLLQQVTGIVTGSIYMDYGLRVHGFPAENVTDGSVLVVKTHEAPPADPKKFKSGILLIRNPRDAILADFNRLHKGHVGTAPKSAFEQKFSDRKTGWVNYVASQLTTWEDLHRLWLTDFSGPLLLVHYDHLVGDTRQTLASVLQFLNVTVSEADMNCAISNKEGIYRRRKKLQDFDPFTPDMYRALNIVKGRVYKMLDEYARTRTNKGDSVS